MLHGRRNLGTWSMTAKIPTNNRKALTPRSLDDLPPVENNP